MSIKLVDLQLNGLFDEDKPVELGHGAGSGHNEADSIFGPVYQNGTLGNFSFS